MKLIYILNIKHQIREPSAQMNGKKIYIHCHYVEHDCISHLLKWVSDYCMNSINNLGLLICILIRIIVWMFNHTLHQGCLVCCSNIAAMLLRYVHNSWCVASSPLNFAKNIQLEMIRIGECWWYTFKHYSSFFQCYFQNINSYFGITVKIRNTHVIFWMKGTGQQQWHCKTG